MTTPMTSEEPRKLYARTKTNPDCVYVFSKGAHKGEKCPRKCRRAYLIDGVKTYRCSYHSPSSLSRHRDISRARYTPVDLREPVAA